MEGGCVASEQRRPWQSFLLLLVLVFAPTGSLASTVAQWTDFFNTDSPKDGMDQESYSNIQMLTGLVCHTGKPTQVECRVVGDDELFHHKSEYRSNILSIPCNLTGLLCDDYLQRDGVRCYDYEIRFLCTVDEISRRRQTSLANKTYAAKLCQGGNVFSVCIPDHVVLAWCIPLYTRVLFDIVEDDTSYCLLRYSV